MVLCRERRYSQVVKLSRAAGQHLVFSLTSCHLHPRKGANKLQVAHNGKVLHGAAWLRWPKTSARIFCHLLLQGAVTID